MPAKKKRGRPRKKESAKYTTPARSIRINNDRWGWVESVAAREGVSQAAVIARLIDAARS